MMTSLIVLRIHAGMIGGKSCFRYIGIANIICIYQELKSSTIKIHAMILLPALRGRKRNAEFQPLIYVSTAVPSQTPHPKHHHRVSSRLYVLRPAATIFMVTSFSATAEIRRSTQGAFQTMQILCINLNPSRDSILRKGITVLAESWRTT